MQSMVARGANKKPICSRASGDAGIEKTFLTKIMQREVNILFPELHVLCVMNTSAYIWAYSPTPAGVLCRCRYKEKKLLRKKGFLSKGVI